IVDDTPGSIVISGFDLVRRYIAKIALERLLEDGRIHPARIEEVVNKAKEEVGQLIKELGEKAAYEAGVIGLPTDLVKVLGRLKFRTTQGQNVLKHSMEVSFIAAALAIELGADVDVCRKAGLLHDVGKAVDHDVQAPHAIIGRDILTKFALPREVIHCVEAHQNDVDPETIEAKLVQVADLISQSRPGADKGNLENFVKRLREIENVANSFSGVKKSYAIQAGREVRVFVDPDQVDGYENGDPFTGPPSSASLFFPSSYVLYASEEKQLASLHSIHFDNNLVFFLSKTSHQFSTESNLVYLWIMPSGLSKTFFVFVRFDLK
ncbi:MAG: Ribonuclease Y, partial [Candidatus Peregrinibacteria bacterium GW2011_GWA2_44_7]